MNAAFTYDYGDTVRVIVGTPICPTAGSLVAVVGMRTLKQNTRIGDEDCPAHTNVYTIEYDDGRSLEFPKEGYFAFAVLPERDMPLKKACVSTINSNEVAVIRDYFARQAKGNLEEKE